MPRTQLYSAASGPARTAFHAHRGVSAAELQVELAQANEVVTSKLAKTVDKAEEVLNKNIDDTRTALSGQVGEVDRKVGEVDADISTVTSITKRIDRNTRGVVIERLELTPEQQEQMFLCLRGLDRAESLAMDTSQTADENNRTLRRIRNDHLVRSGLKTLPDVFQESVQAIHNNFPHSPEEEAKERLERFWKTQEMRQAIMAHFAELAAQRLAEPSSTTAADAPATPDTQS
jgi:hypothetical protein